jgi:AcrR family transcriptional regulator
MAGQVDYTIDLNTLAANQRGVHDDLVSTTTRRYDSPLRVAQAEETRRRVVEAGSRFLSEKGWAGTSMREVAREAGVSVETIYATVGSKVELLKVAMDVAVVGDDAQVPLAERPEFRRMGEGTPHGRLAAAAALMAEINRRGAALHRVLEEGARSEPQLHDPLRVRQDNRWRTTREGMQAVLGRPAETNEVDEVYVVVGPDTYRILVEERGWSREQYTYWLADALARLLKIEETS